MSNDEPPPNDPPPNDPGDEDEPVDVDQELETSELPPMLEEAIESARAVPGLSRRLGVWLPTISAAWRAGRRGVTLAGVLRERVQSDDPVEWPEELAQELGETLHEFAESLPAADEAVPMASELIELGEELIDPDQARDMALSTVSRLERIGQKAIAMLLETAFFAPDPDDAEGRTKRLRRLFTRLETLFDRALETWLFKERDSEYRP